MGKIRSTLIKKNAIKLIELYPEKFSNNFEKNKKEVDRLAEVPSKKLRNFIAGYITTLMNKIAKEVKTTSAGDHL